MRRTIGGETNMPLRTCPQRPVHPSVIEEAERLARRGLMGDAITLLRRVTEEQPDLDLDPETHAKPPSAPAPSGRANRPSRHRRAEQAPFAWVGL